MTPLRRLGNAWITLGLSTYIPGSCESPGLRPEGLGLVSLSPVLYRLYLAAGRQHHVREQMIPAVITPRRSYLTAVAAHFKGITPMANHDMRAQCSSSEGRLVFARESARSQKFPRVGEEVSSQILRGAPCVHAPPVMSFRGAISGPGKAFFTQL